MPTITNSYNGLSPKGQISAHTKGYGYEPPGGGELEGDIEIEVDDWDELEEQLNKSKGVPDAGTSRATGELSPVLLAWINTNWDLDEALFDDPNEHEDDL